MRLALLVSAALIAEAIRPDQKVSWIMGIAIGCIVLWVTIQDYQEFKNKAKGK